jgi:5'-methylthioinosine phosphorylase
MDEKIAIIGGVGFDLDGIVDQVETPYGNVKVWHARLKEKMAVFIPRHGEDHLPPHKVNYRAILWAAKSCCASRVISINTVGSMSYHPIGSFFLPVDFVEFTKARVNTFFEDRAVHVDMSQPYCPDLRSHLQKAMLEMEIKASEGIYVCAEGPHLESPAQIRMMRMFGDVVGMTGYPEVVLAKELELCYASLCIITNEACGMKTSGELSLSKITEQMKLSSSLIKKIISLAAERIPPKSACSCEYSIAEL